MDRVVIFDTKWDGHHSYHLTVLLNYLINVKLKKEVVFAVPEKAWQRALENSRADVRQYFMSRVNNINVSVRVLDDKNLGKIERINSVSRRHFARWKLGIRLAAEVGAQSIYFSTFDDVLLASAIFPQTRLKISGLIFRASIQYPEFRATFKSKVVEFFKYITLKTAIKRDDIKTIFSLDPYFVEFSKKRTNWGKKVIFLPEPYEAPGENLTPSISSATARRAVRFLLYGAMQRRKGVLQVLDAIALLSPNDKAVAEFVFCGEGPLVEEVERRLKELEKSGVNYIFRPTFLSNESLEIEIRSADIILAPYINHVGSSGVLVTAAAMRKPILSQNKGMIGREIKRYKLGEAVNTQSPEDIAKAMSRLIQCFISGRHFEGNFSEFSSKHGCESFAKTIFSHI